MAHQEQIDFCKSVKELYPRYFESVDVLDIGSLDINGNNRYLFDNCNYWGIDIGEGKNVDQVVSGHEFKSDKQFDVIISTECFEHDKYFGATLMNAVFLLKKGGLLLFSCAAPGRPEHGTTRTTKGDSPFTNDYYRNLSEDDIRDILMPEINFSTFHFQTRTEFPQDLYFYGIKI
jgi:SAM-dependent methyltransferase